MRHRASRLIRIHGAVVAQNFVPVEAHMKVDRICGPMWLQDSFFVNFGANMDVGLVGDVACREVCYEEHGYERPTGP